MNFAWAYFWPLVLAGTVIGILASLGPWGRRRRTRSLVAGAVAALVAAALWHGPLGAADSFRAKVEGTTRLTLDYYEMSGIDAQLQDKPLTRTLLLRGRADAFQREELVRVLSQVPGVTSATWSGSGRSIPLFLEGGLVALLGFLLGQVIAYLVELRRRHNAQWGW
jgi:hypothetical protein